MARVFRCALVVTVGAAILLLMACSGLELSQRHRETGLNSTFMDSSLPFPDYVTRMRSVIAQTRVDLTPERREQIIDWNSPFILEPDPTCPRGPSGRIRNGVLLIHGLTESPFQLRDLGGHFRRQCFLVYGLLLPGHGTVPGDLLKVTWENWVKATTYGIRALEPQVDRYFIAGASGGGALALHAALTGARPAALIVFAPAIELHAGRASLGKLLRIVFSLDAGRYWATVAPDTDVTKFESFAVNAAYQLWSFTGKLADEREAHPLRMPVFVVVVAEDMSVESSATLDYFKAVAPTGSRIVIYGGGKNPDNDARITYLPDSWPEELVLNMSHVGVTNAPDNPHYGRRGDYRNCLHYLESPEEWKRCNEETVPAGEITPDNLAQGVIRRVTYNPDFAHLLALLDAFLTQVE